MSAPSAAAARFPELERAAGHYESFYLKAAHPSRAVAVWIRYTVHKRPHADPTGSLWFTLFDAGAGRPRAVKQTLSELGAGEGRYIEIGASSFAPRRASGSAQARGRSADWELELDPLEGPLHHLPRDWMYRTRLPRTKLVSPSPYVRFSGRVRYGDEQVELDRWPGMVGHNWGAQHAERWIWLHAAGFAEDERAWLDVALGRVRLGRLTTPWIANGMLSLGGERSRLGGIRGVRLTEVRETPTRCELTLPGEGLTLQGLVEADPDDVVGWVYADPDGSEHNALNCSVARLALTLSRPGRPAVSLEAGTGATYELGLRETGHGVPVEPFPDG